MGRSTGRKHDHNLYEGLSGFRSALRKFLAFSEAATREAGVTPVQYQALLAIKVHRASAIMIRELADQMLMQHHGAVQLVDRLERAGLAVRHQSMGDQRIVLVTMTEKGALLLERLALDHAQELLRHEALLAESLRHLRRIGGRTAKKRMPTSGRPHCTRGGALSGAE